MSEAGVGAAADVSSRVADCWTVRSAEIVESGSLSRAVMTASCCSCGVGHCCSDSLGVGGKHEQMACESARLRSG
eukprot:4045774-Pleurochrysis_carterae.AAC.1